MDAYFLQKSIEANSDQLNAVDLVAAPRSIKITDVTQGSEQQPVNIHFEGDNGKPYRPSKGMRRILVAVWSFDTDKWVGQWMTLYYEPTVIYAGVEVGGIRISHMTGIKQATKFSLKVNKKKIVAHLVKPIILAKESQPVTTDATKQQQETLLQIKVAIENAVKGGEALLDYHLRNLDAAHKTLLMQGTDEAYREKLRAEAKAVDEAADEAIEMETTLND